MEKYIKLEDVQEILKTMIQDANNSMYPEK